MDVYEISSDEDTVIYTSEKHPDLETTDLELEKAVQKFIAENENNLSLEIPSKYKEIDDLDDILIDNHVSKRVLDWDLGPSSEKIQKLTTSNDSISNLLAKYSSIDDGPSTSSTSSKAQRKPAQAQAKRDKEAIKLERERKKQEAEREKAVKQALNAANKVVKPEECIKYICVNIDNELANNRDYGLQVESSLAAASIACKRESQIVPNLVTWSRNIQNHLIDEDGNIVVQKENQEIEEALLVLNGSEFFETIDSNQLSSKIQSYQSLLASKKLHLAIYGVGKLFKQQKNQKQASPFVSRKAMELALTEMQLLTNCSHRLVEHAGDLSALLCQFTKAIAEKPFKLKKRENLQKLSWYVSGDNRDCVQVDKTGNGLARLWSQTLTMFPSVRLETAEAITAQFPTLNSLLGAYKRSESEKQKENLLAEAPIRRAAGPLGSSRRIGVALSKQVFIFYTSTNGEQILQ